jgi:hypothetical protein
VKRRPSRFRLWLPDGPYVRCRDGVWYMVERLEEMCRHNGKFPDRPRNMAFGLAVEE